MLFVNIIITILKMISFVLPSYDLSNVNITFPSSITSALHFVDGFFPVATLLSVVLSVIMIEIAFWTFRLIFWLTSGIPFMPKK